MATNNSYVPTNFEVKTNERQDFSDKGRLDTLTTTSNSLSAVFIPATATSLINTYKVSYNMQNANTLFLATRRGQGETYTNPITYYVDLGDDFQYQIENYFRKTNGTEKLLFETEGNFDPITLYYPAQKVNAVRITLRLAPFTRVALYNGLIPPGNPGAGTPYWFSTFYNRWDKLINDSQIPAINPASPYYIPSSLSPAPCYDYWNLAYFFTPESPASLFSGFVGPDIGLSGIPYNDTENGKKKWVNLQNEFLPANI